MTTATINESEDKIIERLGDCDAVPVEHMDLLSHRVRCRKLEIFHYDEEVSFTTNDYGEEEEEEQELSYGLFSEDHTDDVDRTVHLVDDLDCLIRRIEQMQLMIKERQQMQQQELLGVSTEQEEEQESNKEPSTPQLKDFLHKQCREPPVVETELIKLKRELAEGKQLDTQPDSLTSDELLEVSQLQKAHHLNQCKIDEIVCNYSVLREVLRTVNNQIVLMTPQLKELNAMADEFHDWSKLSALEMHVCKERYLHLLNTKLSKFEAERVINAHTSRLMKNNKKFLTQRQLRYDLREFRLEIDEIEEYADDLRKDIERRFGGIANDLENMSTPSIRSTVEEELAENHE